MRPLLENREKGSRLSFGVYFEQVTREDQFVRLGEKNEFRLCTTADGFGGLLDIKNSPRGSFRVVRRANRRGEYSSMELREPNFSASKFLETDRLSQGWAQMADEDYHTTIALGSGQLREALTSPSHFYHRVLCGVRAEPTAALEFGRMAHLAVFDQERFWERAVSLPEFDRRTKQGKEDYASWLGDHPAEIIIVKQEDLDAFKGMKASLQRHPVARGLLEKGVAEQPGFFHHRGILGKLKPDWRISGEYIVDLKTTIDASKRSFERSILEYRYHVQAAWYLLGAKKIEQKPHQFIFLAVEKKRPFEVGVYVAGEEVIELGDRLVEKGIDRILRGIETNRWPGYSEQAKPISLPPWAFYDDEEIE